MARTTTRSLVALTVSWLGLCLPLAAVAGDLTVARPAQDLVSAVKVECPAAGGMTLALTTDATALQFLTDGTEQMVAMGRPLDDQACRGETPAQAQSLAVGAASVSVPLSNATCTDPPDLPICFPVSNLNGIAGIDCPGCTGSTYCINDTRDALRLLLTGYRPFDGLPDVVPRCNSDVRHSLVQHWKQVLGIGCPNSSCSALQHLLRPGDKDLAATTLLYALGIGGDPSSGIYCNGTGEQDLDPIRRSCAETDTVCSLNGTRGLVIPVAPPKGVTLSAAYPTEPCQVGSFGFAPSLQVQLSSGFVDFVCPDGLNVAGSCLAPKDSQGRFNCVSPRVNPNVFFQNLSQDARVFNTFVRAANGALLQEPGGRRVANAQYRVSQSQCSFTDKDSQLRCLLNPRFPCALGFGDFETVGSGKTHALAINGILPSWESVRLGAASPSTNPNAYSLVHPTFLNTILGFENVQDPAEQALYQCFNNRDVLAQASDEVGIVPLESARCQDFDETICNAKTFTCDTDTHCGPLGPCVGGNPNTGVREGTCTHSCTTTADCEQEGATCVNGRCDFATNNNACGSLGASCAGGCSSGLTCGEDNGGHFAQSALNDVCWDASICDTASFSQNCGFPGAPCGQLCTPVTGLRECEDNHTHLDCLPGEVCTQGVRWGKNGTVCEPAQCADPQVADANCGSFDAPCGLCQCSGTNNCGPGAPCGLCVCEASCVDVACGEGSADGCNGHCSGTCDVGEPGCTADADCPLGHRCLDGGGPAFGLGSGDSVCVPEDCFVTEVAQSQCGFEGALCGELCPPEYTACLGMECGTDPQTGEACGTCGAGTVCNLQNTCSTRLTSGPPQQAAFSEAYEVGALSGEYATTPTGNASFKIPLRLPPGAGGVEPELEFVFRDMSNIRGPLGPGWSLSGISKIHRCATPAAQDLVYDVRYQENLPTTFCLDGQPLLLDEGMTEDEGDPSLLIYTVADDATRKIVSNGSSFTMHTPDGRIHRYGTTSDSRRKVFGGSFGATATWYIAETKDRFDNVVEYHYDEVFPGGIAGVMAPNHNRGVYPDHILYSRRGSDAFGRRIDFHYVEKTDPLGRTVGYEHHTESVDSRLLESLTVSTFDGDGSHEDIRSYHVEYETIPGNDNDGLKRVAAIRECVRPGGVQKCLPPTEFTYDDPSLEGDGEMVRRFGAAHPALEPAVESTPIERLDFLLDGQALNGGIVDFARALPIDANGDGLKDLLSCHLRQYSSTDIVACTFLRGHISEEGEFKFDDPIAVTPSVPFHVMCVTPASVVDLDGDGREEIVDGCPNARGQTKLAYFRIEENGDLTEHLANKPALGRVHVGDIDGNGRPDFVQDLADFVYFSDFGAYDDGVMQVNLSRVPAHGEPAVGVPLFVDVDGDGVANLLRFSESDQQFFALGFSPDSPGDETGGDVLTMPDGTSYVVVNHEPTWSATSLSYEWDPLPNGGVGNRDTARVLDINGDGLQDIWVQPNVYFAPYEADAGFAFLFQLYRAGADAINMLTAHQHGDHPGPSHLWVNQGGTFKRMEVVLASVNGEEPGEVDGCVEASDEGECLFGTTPNLFSSSTILDYDLDGRQELVSVRAGVRARFFAVEETASTIRIAQSDLPAFHGQEAQFRVDLESPAPPFTFVSNSIWSDFDGDGNTDLVMTRLPEREFLESLYLDHEGPGPIEEFDAFDDLVVYPGHNSGAGRRLRTVTDGLGNYVDVDRALARQAVDSSGDCGRDDTEFGNQPRCLTRLGPLVERVTRGTVDGEHFGSISYTYSHPATANFLQGYYFTERTISEESALVQSTGLPEVVSTTREEYAQALENALWHSAHTYPFLHTPTMRETQLADAQDLNGDLRGRTIVEDRSYRFQGFPGAAYMDERYVRTFDEAAGDEEETKTVREQFAVDAHGLANGYSRTTYTDNSFQPLSELEVTSIRDEDRERWILDKFERVTVTSNGASESLHYEHDDDTGFVTQLTKLYNTDRELVTVYEPDSFGNVATMTESGSRVTQFDYGDAGTFLRTFQNAEGHVQTFEYDDALGMQTVHRNENGYGLIQEYDGFGRVVLRALDNGSTITTESEMEYSEVSPIEVDEESIQSRVRLTVSSDYYSGETVREFDSRGLLVRTQDPGLGVGGATPELVTERTYDWAGRLTASSRAHLASNAPDWSRIEYDDRGRPTSVSSPQGDFSYRYASHAQYKAEFPDWLIDQGLELVHVTDSEGVERVLVSDEKGNNVLTAEGVDVAAGGTGLISKVIYGDWDLPERFIDPELNETVNVYTDDRLLESTEDANRGRTEWTYDAHGNVISELTADGIQSEFTYDAVNRVRTRVDHLAEGDETTEWTYDLDVPGTLSETTGPTGIKTEFVYTPDPRALLALVRHTVGEETFTTQTDLDSLGRVVRIEYPSISVGGSDFTFAVRPTYDLHSGRQVGVQSEDETTNYWQITSVDYTSQSVSVGFGNGAVEERDYDPTTRRLTGIRTENDSGDELSALTYQHSQSGQLLGRSFTHSGDTHVRSFTYDSARRLETVTDDGDTEEFEFSPSGRLLSRTKYGGYDYDADQPHAVTSVGDNEFAYDERGNQYLRTGSDIPGTTQTTRKFSRFNLPVQVDVGDPEAPDETLMYEYDAAGRRVVKRAETANVEVVTPGDLYQRQRQPGTTAAGLHTFRVFADGMEVLQVQYDQETQASEYRYLHRDHLGSVLYTTDEAGEQSEVRDFDAFGEPLSEPDWAETTEEAFTGHKVDNGLGLLEAGARMYDPKFGVFTTPDPMRVSGEGAQAFNPFAYANNDPINWYDPTGFQSEEPEVLVIGERPAEPAIPGLVGTITYGNPSAPDGFSRTYEQLVDGEVETVIEASTTRPLDDHPGAGFTSLHGRMTYLESVGASYPTWDTIGAALTTALEMSSVYQMAHSIARAGFRVLMSRAAAATAARTGSTFGPNTAGAAQRILGNIVQSGGNKITQGTANSLNKATGSSLTPREWGRGLESLKKDLDLPNNYHGKITEYGHYLNEAGEVLGNILEYL